MMTIEELIALGYRRVSRKYGHVARIDRPDWKEALARTYYAKNHLAEGMAWVEMIGDLAEDYYRRCVTADALVLPTAMALKIPTSTYASTGYIPLSEAPDLSPFRQPARLLT